MLRVILFRSTMMRALVIRTTLSLAAVLFGLLALPACDSSPADDEPIGKFSDASDAEVADTEAGGIRCGRRRRQR